MIPIRDFWSRFYPKPEISIPPPHTITSKSKYSCPLYALFIPKLTSLSWVHLYRGMPSISSIILLHARTLTISTFLSSVRIMLIPYLPFISWTPATLKTSQVGLSTSGSVHASLPSEPQLSFSPPPRYLRIWAPGRIHPYFVIQKP